MRISLFLNLILLFSVTCKSQSRQLVNENKPLEDILKERSIQPADLALLIDKSEHRLSVIADTLVLKEYKVVFGGNPKDDKLMQGDKCTPEGTFSILSKYEHKKWSKFIWIDYPNQQSWKKHNAAKASGKIPKDAKIGGEIGIHGVPDGMDFLIETNYNWTLGCISLKNSDIDEIYNNISKQTIVKIQR